MIDELRIFFWSFAAFDDGNAAASQKIQEMKMRNIRLLRHTLSGGRITRLLLGVLESRRHV